ncbi:MAG TPA: phosphomannomutase/phosphoglucomutase [Pseudomonadota bacterium]|nr:phosphomannomutase/phosphoglucomutase [Pseudomonadota bacterium]
MAGIFKAYDIRGTYPNELHESLAARIGAATVSVLSAKRIVIGRDMRQSGPSIRAALIDAVLASGCDVIDIGEVGTPTLYYAVANFEADGGIMITASHNPARYNGFKLCGKGAAPVSYDTGIADIERIVLSGAPLPVAEKRGHLEKRDVLADYHKFLLGLVPPIRPFHMVIDTGNGMMGAVLPPLLAQLPCQVTKLFFEVDGRFPNHEPNPLDPKNMRDLQAKVKEVKADVGIAFDGDGDRAMFVDERGELVPSDQVTALLAEPFLAREPGGTVLYDLRSSWVVRDEILRRGGKPIESRVGHSFIKRGMRETNAIFAGELSGHFYFRDAFFTDNAELAMLWVLAVLSRSDQSFGSVLRPLNRYFATGELNFVVQDKDAVLQKLQSAFPSADISWLDGITVRLPDWWCNVRPSNTEPVLRLNLEAKTRELRDEKRRVVEEIIGGHAASSQH